MTGDSEFCEVFLDGVEVPAGALLGPLHAGWEVAMAVLQDERGSSGAAGLISLKRRLDELHAPDQRSAGAACRADAAARCTGTRCAPCCRAATPVPPRHRPHRLRTELEFAAQLLEASLRGADAMLTGPAARARSSMRPACASPADPARSSETSSPSGCSASRADHGRATAAHGSPLTCRTGQYWVQSVSRRVSIGSWGIGHGADQRAVVTAPGRPQMGGTHAQSAGADPRGVQFGEEVDGPYGSTPAATGSSPGSTGSTPGSTGSMLFASGMSLFDTLDGAFMQAAYRWAFVRPVRKVYYNLTTTGLSVAVALIIGGIEVISVLHDKAELTDPVTSWIAAITLDDVGYIIVAMFVWPGPAPISTGA